MYMNEAVISGSPAPFFLLLVLALISSAQVFAEGVFVEDEDIFAYTEEGKTWKEQAVAIPAYPENEDLLPVRVVSSQFKYFLDSTSISIGSDDVVRYSVVVVSRSGVRNVFYEGMRCDVREYRTYAYGSGDGPFRKMASKWKPITRLGSQRFRSDLYDGYFCKGEAVPDKIENILQELNDSF